MKRHLMMIAMLSSALIVGCGDRGRDNSQNFEQNQAAPVDQVNPPVADSAPQPASPSEYVSAAPNEAAREARATTGRRRAAAPSAPSTSSRPADRFEPAASATENTTSRAAAPAVVPKTEWHEITVPTGTALPLELTTALSSETATVETPVQARLRQAVVVNGYTAIPAGAVLTGTVTDVERSGRVKGRARLVFRFNEIRLSEGREDLRTDPLTFEAEATKGEDATKVGVGAVGGAIVGGILGGGKGAAKGAVVGSAAGAGVVAATRGKEVTLASGSDLAATLATPFTARVQSR